MFKVDESSSVDDETQKAVVRTFLAWQRDPGSPPGQSITKTYLDAESPLALRFVRWLKELYYL
jgi:hypothetical protein